MKVISSISWQFFFIGFFILILIWLFTSRTKVGRSLIHNNTPWTLDQWMRVLMVAAVSLFILVDPVFHIVASVVVIGLYLLLVGQNIKPIAKPRNWDLSEKIQLFDNETIVEDGLTSFKCQRVDTENSYDDRVALDRCLFSFPFVSSEVIPKISYLNETYTVDLKLLDEKYLSSLHSYLAKAGFSINTKTTH